jgi:GntR family transcriptional regulator
MAEASPAPSLRGNMTGQTTERTPRYVQLSDVLIGRIRAGTYDLGSLLPTEVELCEEFSVSRHTVREALRRLIGAGLVKRRQGSGSQVVATDPHQTYVHEMRSLAGLFQYAADTRFRIGSIDEAVPDADEARALGGAGLAPWLIVKGLRADPADGSAICVSTVFIAKAFASIAEDLRRHQGAIYSLIESRFGVEVADVEQEITAVPMPPASARALGLTRKTWAVQVLRRYRDARGTLILASVNHHPAERFSYTMHLKREGRGPA